MKRAVLVAALALAGCKETREVRLTFGSGTATPLGFRCRDDAGKFLVQRGVDRLARKLKVALVIDFLDLGGGLPGCRPGDVTRYCGSHSCTVLADPPRICWDFAQDLGGDETALQAMGTILGSLGGRMVTEDAPHDPVIVRAVASAQTCAELAAGGPPAEAELVGCALSCPAQLDNIDGDVLLELPTLTDRCAEAVTFCAQFGL